jgi:MutS domain V
MEKDENQTKGQNENENENKDSRVSLDNINNIFKIPIFFNDETKKLETNILNDLELVKTNDSNEEQPVYNCIFKPSAESDIHILEQVANYYTTDIQYLKETQKTIENIDVAAVNIIKKKHNIDNYELTKTIGYWKEIRGETGFYEKYFYVDWEFAKHLNNNPLFLQLKSITNFVSPLISLCIPIVILILPFFILKLKGLNISLQTYITILKELIANHAITKIFTEFHEVNNSQKIYLIVSSALYLFSIYQNILSCIRFYSNMKKIHDYLEQFKKYTQYTIESMKYYIQQTSNFVSSAKFNNTLDGCINTLTNLYNDLKNISPFKFSVIKFLEMGHIMKTFYQIYNNETYNNSLVFSFGFNSYFNMLLTFKMRVENNSLSKAIFSNGEKPVFKKMYYPKFIDTSTSEPDKIIKNDCKIDKNMIITGPNASGKTTILKTTLINILLAQQFGYGCFKSLKFSPFEYIHCYLNIPDTSGRDSLFQAEARRCKEIIDNVDENSDKTHFCIFDELYSGTNPDEAVSSANAFLEYLSKKSNVTYMLTTHYIKICKKFNKSKMVINYHMTTLTDNTDGKVLYTYNLEKGISTVKGGVKVLRDMNYPEEIMDKLTKQK